MRRRHLIHGLAGNAIAGCLTDGRTQPRYPSRPVTLVVPFAPGGGGDTTARVLAKGLSDRLGGSVVVENRAGASGNIGAAYVLRSPPDGYTLLSLSSTYGIQAAVGKPPFDPIADMQPIVLATRDPMVLLTHSQAPWSHLKDLVAAAKKSPDTISHGSSGAGSIAHMSMEELAHAVGARFLHVPYKGSSAAMTDLLGGSVQLVMTTSTFAAPYIKSGRVRALGIAGNRRLLALPEVQIFAEQGQAFQVFDWKAVAAPKGVPGDIVSQLNAALNDVLRAPAVAERFEADGSAVVGGSHELLAHTLREDIGRWRTLVRQASIRIE
jgi:tripartite-type tricarboxylate transporter receptor subunit TctC